MPSLVAQTSLSLAQPTTVGAGVGDTSSVLPDAKPRTSILVPRMYASRSPAGEMAGELAPTGAITVAAPDVVVPTRGPLPPSKQIEAASADHCAPSPGCPLRVTTRF